MAKRNNSNDSLVWSILLVLAFMLFASSYGCESPQTRRKQMNHKRSQMADEITCYWSYKQVREGACWYILDRYRSLAITLVPDRFCSKER